MGKRVRVSSYSPRLLSVFALLISAAQAMAQENPTASSVLPAEETQGTSSATVEQDPPSDEKYTDEGTSDAKDSGYDSESAVTQEEQEQSDESNGEMGLDLSTPQGLEKLIEKVSFHLRQNQIASAVELLVYAKKAGVNAPELTLLMGKCYVAMGKIPRAITFLKRAAKSQDLAGEAFYTLGRLYLVAGNYSAALANLLKAREATISSPILEARVNYSLGVAAYFNGDIVLARESLAEALWSEQLTLQERDSAVEFMRKANQLRPWGIVIPTGLRYSGNLFRLSENSLIPPSLESNQAWSMYLGLNASKVAPPDQGGVTLGQQFRFHIDRLLDLQLQRLNSALVDYSFIQSFGIFNNTPIRLQQFIGYFSPSQSAQYIRLGVESSWRTYLVGLGVDIDTVRNSKLSKDTLWLNFIPKIIFTPGDEDQIQIDSYILYRRPLNKSDENLETLSMGLQPTYELTLSPKTQINAGFPIQTRFNFPIDFSTEYVVGAKLGVRRIFSSQLVGSAECGADGVLKGVGNASNPQFNFRLVWIY